MEKTIAVVVGTRPEAIKMAPLILELKRRSGVRTRVIATAQHRGLLDEVLSLFGIVPDVDLDLMRPGQSLESLTCGVLTGIGAALRTERPDYLLVHGDTTTAMSAALAAFYEHLPVGHVEAGLRTYDLGQPWPEELNRRVIDLVTEHYFAPTEMARANLIAEKIGDERIVVTGNTVVDALLMTVDRIGEDSSLHARLAERFSFLDPQRRMVLVTGHRRENHGQGLESVCRALKELADRGDVDVLYPLHPNPAVHAAVRGVFGDRPNIHMVGPQDYLHFVYLMHRASLILTDSGGIQEEAPSLGKPVLVLRDVTERPEAIAAGTIRLVGTNEKRILTEANHLLDDSAAYADMSHRKNPFGDGHASARIVDALLAA